MQSLIMFVGAFFISAASAQPQNTVLAVTIEQIELDRQAQLRPVLLRRQSEIRTVLNDLRVPEKEKLGLIRSILQRYSVEIDAILDRTAPRIQKALFDEAIRRQSEGKK